MLHTTPFETSRVEHSAGVKTILNSGHSCAHDKLHKKGDATFDLDCTVEIVRHDIDGFGSHSIERKRLKYRYFKTQESPAHFQNLLSPCYSQSSWDFVKQQNQKSSFKVTYVWPEPLANHLFHSVLTCNKKKKLIPEITEKVLPSHTRTHLRKIR